MRRRLRIGRVLDCFTSSVQCAGGCLCVRALEDEEDAAVEREALVASGRRRQQQVLRLRDLVDGTRTLGFHLQPKTVELRVAMHCNGCAKKVHKHISKMEAAQSVHLDQIDGAAGRRSAFIGLEKLH
ncbi:hypothetical protein PVAP13_3NG258072 [Panicum virgatum]|uniref:HMA domain-containing protein n=1 Tax=Panicum virgatum TaxID=38727 RepID=A0A8T0U184_PANVG|nr:hypothetical protein PVAP13_3NG258072 [Panicum virgatum]